MPLSIRRIHESPWQAFFSGSAISRGIAYAQQGSVLSRRVTLRSDQLVIQGEVATEQGETYAVEVLCHEARGKLVLNTTCTCAVTHYCKHGVALLHALEDLQEPCEQATQEQRAEWDRWFERAALLGSSGGPAAQEHKILGFVLNRASDGSPLPLLRARPAWFRARGSNTYQEVQPFTSGELATRQWVSQVDDAQHALLARLLVAPVVHAQGTHGYSLEGRRGEQLLHDLLATQPCFWRRLPSPLALGPKKDLAWEWQTQDDGTQRLSVHRQLAGVKIARAENLWYVDEASGHIGQLAGDPASVAAAYDMPPLHPELISHVATHWGAVKQLRNLPPPQPLSTANWDANPSAALWLRHADPKKTGTPEDVVFHARLVFDYGGIEVPAYPPNRRASRIHDGRPVLIERDQAYERRSVEAVRQQGFMEAGKSGSGAAGDGGGLQPGDWILKEEGCQDVQALLQRVPLLREAGLEVRFVEDFPYRLLETREPIQIAWSDALEPHLVRLGVYADLEGAQVSLLPLLQGILADKSLSELIATEAHDSPYCCLALDAQRQLVLRREPVRALVSALIEWLDGGPLVEGQLTLPRAAFMALSHLQHTEGLVQVVHSERLTSQQQGGAPANNLQPPAALRTQLRGYQLDGLRWLESLRGMGIGGILADDMGLGKTLQILAHLLLIQQALPQSKPSIVVCPTSVLLQWVEQAAQFAPSLKVLTLRGADRSQQYPLIGQHDLVLTSYPLLVRDLEALLAHDFELAVFDEAQAIKNAQSKTAKAARLLQARRKVMVTGTPLENHLGELWTQMDVALPGLLGNQRSFRRYYRLPIEKFSDTARQAQLRLRLAPFILRRTKSEVAPELPPKTEVLRHIELTEGQRALYESVRVAMHERVCKSIAARGIKQASVVVLDALLKLRQICCDPRLLKGSDPRPAPESAKLDALMLMLPPLIEEGRRILLFSQFTQMLDLIEAEVEKQEWPFVRLDGNTSDREQPIKRFMKGKTPLFLLSLKAGGTGLNLTAADTVIHYDPWWNPAAEVQATDRAHRIGQDKPVFAYKLICAGTIEDRIQALQREKSALAHAILENALEPRNELDMEDIHALFAPIA